MAGKMSSIDGNMAATHVAYAFSDVAAIYPITPSSPMGEYADEWAATGRKNLFGKDLEVIEMQSEGGAAGAVHGALSAGALTTTFTASQGLMLMLPNMFKIAGEMMPTVFHVSARSLACQSLSIFGDHSDVMAVRGTGFGMMAAAGIQEVMDLALVSHLATLKAQVPFLNFFDGFRTSHEVQKVEMIDYEDMAALLEPQYVERFRKRAMRPDNPILKVGAQNPDVYFQGRETCNQYYDAMPEIVQSYMDKVAKVIGRQYHLFDYVGAPDAEKVVIAMGSSCDTIEEAVNYLWKVRGEKVGAIKVRLYRPFSAEAFIGAMPDTVKKVAVLDRTKEPGALGEPMYLDVVSALKGKPIEIIGGRYGLSSKEFTPSMVKAVFDHLEGGGFHGFTVGIVDDVTNLSIPVNEEIDTEPEGVVRCMFWGLGSDGTVGANKNSIKIIGDNTDMNTQGYFVYDSKKSGGITISHLRFGKNKIQSPYLIAKPEFVACHNPAYIGRYDMLNGIQEGGTFLLNSEWDSSVVFNHLTEDMQRTIIDKKLKFYNIDALKISSEAGLGLRINTVMMAAFFKISGILEEDKAIELIKGAIKKTFLRKGEDIVNMNWECVDQTAAALTTVPVPASMDEVTTSFVPPKLISEDAPQFAKDVIEPLMHLEGDALPVSKMSFDGVIPTGTTCLEKRGIAPRVPRWLSEQCIQCNQCSMACPHGVIRSKQIAPADLEGAPEGFETLTSKTKNDRDLEYRIQVYVEDCTGCGVCVETCPAKTKALEFAVLDDERDAGQTERAEFFDALPENVFDGIDPNSVKGAQFRKPLFEFSGACAGCGETPYVKLVTQLFGERMIIANATGCSSIYGGTFPTIPYCTNEHGEGPTWGNSLFEDNAEYAFGMRLAVDSNRANLKAAVEKVLELGTTPELTAKLQASLAMWDSVDGEAMAAGRASKAAVPAALEAATDVNKEALAKLAELQDYFVDKSVWAFGGDGWAYDIGYGGLDHVLASGRNVNVLVMDTEVYSNTGGQASKATPIGAVAKFANAGKRLGKKNMGLMCMSYGYIYVASIAMGANRNQTMKALLEAEAYDGPSIVMAYSPCIAHGINMMESQLEQKLAVEAGYYPLYRFNPAAEKPFTWETKAPKGSFQDFIRRERRYTTLFKTAPDEAESLLLEAEEDAKRRFETFQKMGDLM
ncbi:MAG: pyruvate:ferredoxin (flavodoxin) oxidoreductase [Lentisphaerae bacterium]|jgi:pyruvate-ferredoxin/flavodoxin oxidoreductase|nr:pyruvate:ferredoxin (flavodoxin) oxidoreductase [Lentisphaerota bacterium]MBT4822510.1 pyruvate:ferredoxin (flavodoxin) oxidoreductase [Lentisphaerota bacterium]MBT5605976.1 pyruvate:ferredoxin (flavodoxin) oxidoreductase [Lentisphaerota bacterium]MBT7060546.1 pyruvate:ferredoxin (flavodoxin) oxidoreductase [Lentisphaerota bacterium]MBT7847999.1 pyruvate:ferredoxin (flavodoxin) oxidoreductase [Lentisphaerota bacterium]